MRKNFVILVAALFVILSLVSCLGTRGEDDEGTYAFESDLSGIAEEDEEKTAENKAENDIDAEKNSLNQSKIEGADGNIDSKSGLKTDTSELSANTDKNNEDAAAGGEAYTSSSAFAKQPENEGNVSENDEYAVFDGALFIGDSRTEGLSLYSGIKNADFFCAKSLSIDKVTDGEKVTVFGTKMSIYELLESKNYKKVYISLGLNELGWTHIERYIEEYTELINAVKESQPDAVIFVQALLPVSKEKSDKGGTVNNAQIYWYNTNLAKMAEDTGTLYINADTPLIDENGCLLPDAATDGVHLKSEYCKIWARRLAELSSPE